MRHGVAAGWVCGVVVAAGCVGSDPPASPTSAVDAGGGGADTGLPDSGGVPEKDAAPDADAAAPRCDRSKAFDAVTEVVGFDGVHSARFSPDESTVYVTYTCILVAGAPECPAVAPEAAVLVRTRGADGKFGVGVKPPEVAAVPILALNSAADEFHATVSADGLVLVHSSYRPTVAPEGHLFRYQRSSTSGPFLYVDEPIFGGNGVLDASPYLAPSKKALYFGSTRGTGGVKTLHYGLFRAQQSGISALAPNGVYDFVVALAALGDASVKQTYMPVVSDDERTIYYAQGAGGTAEHDIYVATASSPGTFTTPGQAVGIVNSSDLEWPTWVSPDDCHLYLVRQASDSSTRKLYLASRPK